MIAWQIPLPPPALYMNELNSPEYCNQVFVCAANQLTTSFLSLGWPFGSLVCKMSGMVQGISVSASVFTLVAIAVDR